MESKKLEALLMAVDLGSFTKAAEVLGYTQSGLTHMMNSLEKEVGFTLLERGRSGVRLTEEGERIAPAVREFLQANARARQRDRAGRLLAHGDHPRQRLRQHRHALAAGHHPALPRGVPDVDVDIRMADHVDVPLRAARAGQDGRHPRLPAGRGPVRVGASCPDDPMFAVLPKDFDTQGMTAFPLAALRGARLHHALAGL